ncbi:MAG: transglutaminase-like domain-containing protein [Candidatus Heimdallarchaeota archaeon]
MSQESRRQRSLKKKPEGPPKRKIFTKSTISKVFLPSLALIGIILVPVIFEALKTRHQAIEDVVASPVPGNWFDNLFTGGAPSIGVDPDDPDVNGTNPGGFLDGFTEGLQVDPFLELFRITPSNHYFNWRLEVYDTYLSDTWDKDIATNIITGYTGGAPGDGELYVTSNITYFGGTSVRNYPAPYHYVDGEVFSDDYSFVPSVDWDEAQTTLEEDIYDCNTINARFFYSSDNSTLTYSVSYTLQDNDYIKDNSDGYAILNNLIAGDTELSTRYLQAPSNFTLDAPLTNQIAANLYDNSLTIYQQAFKNMLYLSKNYTYDLDMLLGDSTDSPAAGEDYVEWFMNRNSGTSAHFASALTMLCRLQGIPSRIAVGFSYGDRIGNEFIIRPIDVHSWTEIFLPINGVGRWVQFDSSPLVPTLRDIYGENTIGFQATFHCSNEFFIEDQHMTKIPVSPYFTPNPSSAAWYYDGPTSTWYGPYVNRSQTFTLYSFLGNGNDYDFYIYLATGILGNLLPIEGEEIFFIDTTTNDVLGSAFTNSSGYATLDYSYNSSSISGIHFIEAEWSGIRASTYDLRYVSTSTYIDSGVIVVGSVNVSSIHPEIIVYTEFSATFTIEKPIVHSQLIVFDILLSRDTWYQHLLKSLEIYLK